LQYHKQGYMAKKELKNRWKEHHEFLDKQTSVTEKSKATACKEEICRLTGWSLPTFYRKLSNPTGLSISEKITIANVYDMPIHFLFPEMEKETA
jgi:hypothetical protein